MSNLIHACLYNLERESTKPLIAHIQDLNFVRLHGEINTADALYELLQAGTLNMVFFHLDPNPQAVVGVIEQVSTRFPELALIALSHNTDPESIIVPMRAGCDQFVCEPIDPGDLTRAVARVASRRLLNSTKSRCICVMGASGGAGATTIACNVALEIGQLVSRECALVDLDLQYGDAAINFDCEPNYSLHDIADAGADLDKAVLMSTVAKLPCNVVLLSRPESIEQHEAVTADVVNRVIDLLATIYENVVVDLPGHFDARTVAAMNHADIILIVCQMLVPSVRHARRTVDMMVRLGIPPERIKIVVNRGDARSGRLSAGDLENTLKKKIYATIPNDYQFVARSIDIGRPIAELDRNNPVRAAIRQLARKIIGGASGESEGQESQKGLLSRLLAK